jgi:glutathione S-transferase
MTATLYVGNRNYSSWSLRGSLLLRQSGLDCREIVIPLDTRDGKTKIREVSPTGRVPVLHSEGLVIWDSLAIAEYLAERCAYAGLWPKHPEQRAHARSVSAEMHSGFAALRSQMPMDIRGQHSVAETPALCADIERVEEIWADCRGRFGRSGNYLFGAWCAADAMYAPVVSRFRSYGVKLSPVAAEYAAAVWEWPALQTLAAEAHAEPWSLDLGL